VVSGVVKFACDFNNSKASFVLFCFWQEKNNTEKERTMTVVKKNLLLFSLY